jgi:hypothetical protein
MYEEIEMRRQGSWYEEKEATVKLVSSDLNSDMKRWRWISNSTSNLNLEHIVKKSVNSIF